MEKLCAKWAEGKFLCIGLDTDLKHKKFPQEVMLHRFAIRHVSELGDDGFRQLCFNCWVVDFTRHVAGAYKPNLAFYGGIDGKRVLKLTIEYMREVDESVPVILDAKQGDIDNTNNGYVEDDFGFYDADAVTVHNYLGMEAMKPFLDRADKGVIVLCRTSNNGAGEFQDLPIAITKAEAETLGLSSDEDWGLGRTWSVSAPLYQMVAHRVSSSWNYNGNCAVVVGATYPRELKEVRKIVGDGFPILIPGVGTQGGDVKATVDAGKDANGQGMIINVSRAVIFPWEQGENFSAARIGQVAEKYHKMICDALAAASSV